MSTPYRPILATLGYVFSPDGQRVLLIHRNLRQGDDHLGKYNGLGGKLEPAEHAVAGMVREIREEAGIECRSMDWAGTINWPGFGKNGEDWFGFVFRIHEFKGVPFEKNPEGTLAWHSLASLDQLPFWEGDRHFLPLVIDPGRPSFHGVMPYRDGKPVSWTHCIAGASQIFTL